MMRECSSILQLLYDNSSHIMQERLLDSKQTVCYKKYMSEGVPIPPGEEANQEAGFSSGEQPREQSPDKRQRFDAGKIAAALEKAGLHTHAENMRQSTASDEEIRQRNHPRDAQRDDQSLAEREEKDL